MVKLNKKKNGTGKVTSYTINISKKEVEEAGFTESDTLEKQTIKNKMIIYKKEV